MRLAKRWVTQGLCSCRAPQPPPSSYGTKAIPGPPRGRKGPAPRRPARPLLRRSARRRSPGTVRPPRLGNRQRSAAAPGEQRGWGRSCGICRALLPLSHGGGGGEAARGAGLATPLAGKGCACARPRRSAGEKRRAASCRRLGPCKRCGTPCGTLPAVPAASLCFTAVAFASEVVGSHSKGEVKPASFLLHCQQGEHCLCKCTLPA